jgi:deazaflavin-dependent oxidoreductase (nitroreductase family)
MDIGEEEVRVDVVLDLICVHSYIGYARLTRAVATFRAAGGTVQIRFAPFELAPGAPTSGMPLLDALAQKFGPEAVRRLGPLARAAVADGLDLRYDRAIATGTSAAHQTVTRAARQGLAEPMVERLFRAHFTDGLNIGDPETLDQLAAEVGVTAPDTGVEEDVRSSLKAVREVGVTGVPVFRFQNGPTLAGEQTQEVFLEALRTAAGAPAGGRPGAVVDRAVMDGEATDGVAQSPRPEVARHVQQYLATDGEQGHDYYGFPTLLLTTRGRRTGTQYRTALIYGRDSERYVLVASDAAAPENPHWYQNLLANPETTVQVRGARFTATARPAEPGERARLWALMAGVFPMYDQYASQTTREIPVVVLEPRPA